MSCNLDSNAYQTICSFECDEGYLIHGSPNRVCEADQQWSGAEVKCTGRRLVKKLGKNSSKVKCRE